MTAATATRIGRIYRAVPAHVTEIRSGDWVSRDEGYALMHAEGSQEYHLGELWHVIHRDVPEHHIEWAGPDKDEWHQDTGEKREYFYRPPTLNLSLPFRVHDHRPDDEQIFEWAVESLVALYCESQDPALIEALHKFRPDLPALAILDEVGILCAMSADIAELRDQHPGRWTELESLEDEYAVTLAEFARPREVFPAQVVDVEPGGGVL